MKKYFCDRCEKEVKRLYRFEYLCHIENTNLNGIIL